MRLTTNTLDDLKNQSREEVGSPDQIPGRASSPETSTDTSRPSRDPGPPARDGGRRGFLIGAAQAAIAGMVGAACRKVEETDKGNVLSSEGQEVAGIATTVVEAVPEYERTLQGILIGVESNRGSLRRVVEALLVLPSYTKVTVVGSADTLSRLRTECAAAGVPNEIQGHLLPSGDTGDGWSQDWGEWVLYNGKRCVLVPMEGDIPPVYAGKRNRRLAKIYGSRVILANHYFEGGNVAFDRYGDGMRVLTGTDTILKTISLEARRGTRIGPREVVARIRKQYGANDVLVLGPKKPDGTLLPQAKKAFHIDLSFVLLHGQVAVCSRVPREVFPHGFLERGGMLHVQLSQNDLDGFIAQQRRIEADLKANGYETVGLEHGTLDLKNGFSSVNAIPYVDADTGRRTVMFPVFQAYDGRDGEYDYRDAARGPLAYGHLRGKGKAAFDLFNQLGYVPIPVPEYAINTIAGGAIHCRTNVIAGMFRQTTSAG